MAVYTHLSAEDLTTLIAEYDVGRLVSAKGIAEGVSNSNWLIETTGADGNGARFILTMYERRIALGDLPFFLGLLDHLAARGMPVPRTIHDCDGAASRMIDGKAVALIEFLPGVSVDLPSARQAHNVGRALARMHGATADFDGRRANDLRPADWAELFAHCGDAGLASINPQLPGFVAATLPAIAASWPEHLPTGVIHADLFPDNVLMLGDEVSGMIDFYFACHDILAYDLAVTHVAWSFGPDGLYRPDIGSALIEGYRSERSLSAEEIASLPVLAQGAALRFMSTRSADWLDTPADALVARKDPMDFVRRCEFYAENGVAAFT